MSMRETFAADLKEAMKAGDRIRVSTIRLINAAVKDLDIEARGAGKNPISDGEIRSLLQKKIKQGQETLEMVAKAGRADLADQARAEIAVLTSYLPAQMSVEAMREAITAAIASTGATGVKDMGKVMGALRERHAGAMDLAKAGPLVKAQLGG